MKPSPAGVASRSELAIQFQRQKHSIWDQAPSQRREIPSRLGRAQLLASLSGPPLVAYGSPRAAMKVILNPLGQTMWHAKFLTTYCYFGGTKVTPVTREPVSSAISCRFSPASWQ